MKGHAFDAISFLAGLVLALTGILFLVPYRPTDLFEVVGDIGGWMLAAILVAVGLVVLAPAIAGLRNDGQDEEDQAG